MKNKYDEKKWNKARKRIFEITEVGYHLDKISCLYDMVNVFTILLNLAASILYTYDGVRTQYGSLLLAVETVTAVFFAVDYMLRVISVRYKYGDKNMSEGKAIRNYVFSFMGIVDLLSWIPYFLPVFFPAGTVAFRMIRVVRILRLFRVNAYHDSLSIITEVLYEKRQQLVSSVFIILMLMIGSSLCMYSLEHEAQPEVFSNAFSGIWWATSTLLTVGYGDIYPITTLGKIFGIFISFLGVGMVAIPTGIISAGFVNQYTTIKSRTDYGYKMNMDFIRIHIEEGEDWCNKKVADLSLPSGMIMAVIKRGDDILIPRGDVVLIDDDIVVLGAIPYESDEHDHIELQEIVLKKQHPWAGLPIKKLDISRQSVIVLIKRRNKAMIPNGNMMLEAGDRVFLYTKLHLADAHVVEV